MKTEPKLEQKAGDAVTPLTAEQVAQVAGGVAKTGLGAGCPTCSSGRMPTFANLAAQA